MKIKQDEGGMRPGLDKETIGRNEEEEEEEEEKKL